MRISNQLCIVLLTALLTGACGDENAMVPPGEIGDAGLAASDPDARVSPPDAAPVPDAPPGTPDGGPPDAAPPPVSFTTDLLPVLMARCGGCHLKDTLGAGGLSFGVQGQL